MLEIEFNVSVYHPSEVMKKFRHVYLGHVTVMYMLAKSGIFLVKMTLDGENGPAASISMCKMKNRTDSYKY